MVVILRRDQVHAVEWPEGGCYSASSDQTAQECPLRGYENIVLLERRGDHVKGVNLGRAVEKSCQGLQHLRICIGVVSIGIVLVFPQTDCGHIYSARTGERDFVLETILSTKQGKDVLLKSSGVIGQHIGFQMNRNIACIHIGNLLWLGLLRETTSDELT